MAPKIHDLEITKITEASITRQHHNETHIHNNENGHSSQGITGGSVAWEIRSTENLQASNGGLTER
jgi:hypothetical protein